MDNSFLYGLARVLFPEGVPLPHLSSTESVEVGGLPFEGAPWWISRPREAATTLLSAAVLSEERHPVPWFMAAFGLALARGTIDHAVSELTDGSALATALHAVGGAFPALAGIVARVHAEANHQQVEWSPDFSTELSAAVKLDWLDWLQCSAGLQDEAGTVERLALVRLTREMIESCGRERSSSIPTLAVTKWSLETAFPGLTNSYGRAIHFGLSQLADFALDTAEAWPQGNAKRDIAGLTCAPIEVLLQLHVAALSEPLTLPAPETRPGIHRSWRKGATAADRIDRLFAIRPPLADEVQSLVRESLTGLPALEVLPFAKRIRECFDGLKSGAGLIPGAHGQERAVGEAGEGVKADVKKAAPKVAPVFTPSNFKPTPSQLKVWIYIDKQDRAQTREDMAFALEMSKSTIQAAITVLVRRRILRVNKDRSWQVLVRPPRKN